MTLLSDSTGVQAAIEINLGDARNFTPCVDLDVVVQVGRNA